MSNVNAADALILLNQYQDQLVDLSKAFFSSFLSENTLLKDSISFKLLHAF